MSTGFRRLLAVVLSLLFVTGIRVVAGPLVILQRDCRVEDYYPKSVIAFLMHMNIGRVSFLTSGSVSLLNLKPEFFGVVRDGFLIGQYSLTEQIRKRVSQAAIYDLDGESLFSISHANSPCPVDEPTHRCDVIEIEFEADRIDGKQGFRLTYSDEDRFGFERYGKVVNFYVWSRQLRTSLDWLIGVLLAQPLTSPSIEAARDRLQLVLDSDWYLSPYAADLSYQLKDGHWNIAGVVPHESYIIRIKGLLHNAGYRNVVYQLTVGGEQKQVPSIPPAKCYGYADRDR